MSLLIEGDTLSKIIYQSMQHFSSLNALLQCLESEFLFDPPGHGRIGGHYFHKGSPYVRHKNKNALYNANIEACTTIQRTPCLKIMTTYWLGPGGLS